MAVEFDITLFRQRYPVFDSEESYPDSLLDDMFAMASCYISTENYGLLKNGCRLQALNLLVAHLLTLDAAIQAGNTPGRVTAATVGRVSVTLEQPPLGDAFDWWLSLTPYGQRLQALLAVSSAAGFYVGGSLERKGFRKIGGGF
jgi:hypothetical protein